MLYTYLSYSFSEITQVQEQEHDNILKFSIS